jgi:hypothetical protein
MPATCVEWSRRLQCRQLCGAIAPNQRETIDDWNQASEKHALVNSPRQIRRHWLNRCGAKRGAHDLAARMARSLRLDLLIAIGIGVWVTS